ncbi:MULTISPECIES: phage tail terminator-like protein [unclassified Cupriavidus]|uniref:phage tail terminator-like protein n=1 Tax=unclassified Cupriavidus TaxID=2640874 RepID=UPI00313E4594
MSNVAVRRALEQHLDAMTPALSTAWQNVSFTPDPSAPYQEATLLLGAPENPAYGAYYREVGVLQVALMYPFGGGTAEPELRAQAIRYWFARGTTVVVDDIEVVVQRTPTIAAGFRDNDRWRVPVSIPFFASANA